MGVSMTMVDVVTVLVSVVLAMASVVT